MSKTLGILYKAKPFLNEPTMLLLYNSLFLPYLNYCCEIWGNGSGNSVKKICSMQNKAIAVISNCKKFSHTTPLYVKYNTLKFADIVQMHTCLLAFKANNNMLPHNLQRLFSKNHDVHQHNTRQNKLFHVESCRGRSDKHLSIISKSIQLWNNQSTDVRCSQSVHSFKKSFKKEIICLYKEHIT